MLFIRLISIFANASLDLNYLGYRRYKTVTITYLLTYQYVLLKKYLQNIYCRLPHIRMYDAMTFQTLLGTPSHSLRSSCLFLFKECVFEKKHDDTVLRVQWNGDMRLIHKGSKVGSCRRWYFTLNGKECSQPETIDAVLFASKNNTNNHRPCNGEK